MAKVFLRSFSTILVIFVPFSQALECEKMDKCMCFKYDKLEYQCPINDPEISIKITPKNNVEMQCIQSPTPFFNIDLLPNLDMADSTVFKLQYCYLNTTFTNVLRKFKIKNLKYLTFETTAENDNDRIIDISKEMFESLQSLEFLSLGFSTLNLHVDFLENTPNLLQLTMNKNGLSSIDKYFNHTPKLRYLDLSRNEIGSLPDGVFENLNNLTRLYLWNNNLTGLNKNTFKGVNNLQLLELSWNHIEHIEEGTFSGLTNVVNISLRSNNIKDTYGNMFSTNTLVKNIRLSYNPNLTLADYLFANLTLLQTVELSYNNLDQMPENTFRNCLELKDITLKRNRFITVPETLFKDLKKLTKLDMSENKIASLPGQVFASLENLEELNLRDNQLRHIAADHFQTLDKLKVLNLGKNKISVIDLTAFRGLQYSLTSLDLSYNLWNGTSNLPFDATPLNDCLKLEELNLSHNLFTRYPDMIPLLNLRKVDLSYNLIDQLLVLWFADVKKFTLKIDLTGNQIQQVDFQFAEKGAALNIENSADLNYNKTELVLNQNPIACDCSNYELVRYNNDEMRVIKKLVDIDQDKLTCSNDNRLLVKSIKTYQVHCPVLNQCPSPCKCSYMPYNTAVVVDCSFLNLTFYPNFYFNETNHYQIVLNMSGNQLENGPPNHLNYENVTYLDLSRNHISEMSWIPPHMKELNLSDNSLRAFSSHFVNVLKTSYSLERVYLKGNMWNCDCQALDLQNYLKQYYNKVNSSEVYCHNTQTQLVKLTDLCKVSLYLTVLLPVFLTLLLFFAVALALFYRYQTEIKIYLYAKNLCLWFVTEEELDKDKTYDVFISYSHQDEVFVVKHLLPELEQGDTPFKVCFHIRDWVPGKFIAEQVVSSVKDSRRTLVVLSNHFVESDWGKLEFRTAHTESMQEGRARVIVVIYGDLDESKLDDEFKSYLKTNTYVKWGDKYFWNKLKYALPHSKNNFYESNKKQARMMLKIDEKFDLINTPPSPTNTSTPPITLDPSLLDEKQIKIDIPNRVEGEDPLLKRQS